MDILELIRTGGLPAMAAAGVGAIGVILGGAHLLASPLLHDEQLRAQVLAR